MSCCRNNADRKTPPRGRTTGRILAWLLPGASLALMPKCPACLAAYVMVWTGIGLTFSEAAWLRWGLLTIFCGALVVVALKRFDPRLAIRLFFKQETRPCNTKS